MLGGLATPLVCIFAVQSFVALPLLLPFKRFHKPTIFLATQFREGPGRIVSITLGSTIFVMFASSLWEIISLERSNSETGHQALMVQIQLARAQLVCTVCVINLMMGIILPRFASEVAFHDKLRKSHAALQRQAAGLSQEYSRATSGSASGSGADEVSVLKRQVDIAVQARHTLMEEMDQLKQENKKAEKALKDVKSQAKNLETSYDALMAEFTQLQQKAGVEQPEPARKKDD